VWEVSPLSTGSVVAPGELFKAFTEISGVLKSARNALLIVDPYMDHTVLQEYALVAAEGVSIRLLHRQQ